MEKKFKSKKFRLFIPYKEDAEVLVSVRNDNLNAFSKSKLSKVKMLDKIKKADSLEVNSLGIIDKIMVLSIRHQASKKEIQSMNGGGLLVYAIQKGMIGKSSVQRNRIGEVKLNGGIAKGQIVSGEQITPVYFDFNKEKGVWKIDLTSVFSLGTIGFKQVLKKSGLKENEYLIQVLEQMTGKKPSTKIWNPSL